MIGYYSVLLITWCITNINAQQLLSVPYQCNFDAAPCYELRNLADNQNVNWTRVRGPTPSANTGPEGAHSPEFYYLFESSSPVQQGQSASFITLPLAASAGTTICVEFFYHMYGASMGSLYVNATSRFDGGTFDQNLVRLTGNQGNVWLKIMPSRFTVVDSQRTRIQFRAIRGSDYTSDIGIDDISITNCDTSILPFVCDFEDALDRYCGMYNGTGNDNMDWNALNTATGSSRTGPDRAESGMWYVYIEATTNSNNPNRNAILYFPAINTRQPYPTRVCLTFYYHMYGTSIQSLEVYTTQTTTRWDVITGDQGNQWIQRRVSLDLLSPTDQIFLVGNIGFDIYGDIAVDNVRIDLGNCIITPTPTPIPTYRLPYQCGFETTDFWCGISQSTDDQFDWTRKQGPTLSDNTGPMSAYDGQYYIYTEVSDARDGDVARIVLPMFDYVGPVCVQFYYHMYGNNIGRLIFYMTSAGSASPFVIISGNQGNQWNFRQATAYVMSRTDRITIEANRVGGVQGDIALDDIRVTAGECTTVPGPITLPYSCGFEQDSCGIRQLAYPDDYFDWTRFQGPTPDVGTGPSAAYQGSWYYYADMSGSNKINAKALLPAFSYVGFVCLDFYYHLWGANVGSLKIYTTSTGSNNPIATIVGNQGNQWLRRRETIYLRTTADQIGFEAVRGNGDFGDIAVDNIQVTQGQCPVSQATVPYFCGFETDFCNMEQQVDDEFDWTRMTGHTDSANTGPDSAYEGLWYMYTEVSDPRNINARILLPAFNYVGRACLEFFYHMWGANVGELRVYTTTRGPAYPLIVLMGNKGNQWLKWSETITINGTTDRIGFQGTRGNGIEGDIAVDNVRVTPGMCQGVVEPLPYQCDFETDMCNMEQVKDDRFDWTRMSGSTPSANTGPTQAFDRNWYIYTEVSGLMSGDYARILLPQFDYAGPVCLDYAYHMWGATMGRLNIYTVETGVNNPIVTISTDQGNRWIRARNTIVLKSRTDRIGFEGIAGPGIEGDIALDSIYVRQGSCETSPVTGLPFTCGFETGLCGIEQLSDDNFDWTNNTGPTPTTDTGPSQAYSGNYYMYTEVSGRRMNDVARLLLPEFNYVGDVCVSFYYHMWGTDIGTLTLFTRTNNVDAPVFSISGDQGDAWRYARRTVFVNSPRTRIGIQGNAGDNIRGDIAIDNIVVSQGLCPGTTPVPTTTPAPTSYINLPFSCDFELADICGMRQSRNDNLDWTRYAFATQTQGTGPTQAQMGNYYMYIEGDQMPYGVAKLEFPPINYVGRACLSYYYYMYGADLGSLDVYTSRAASLALIQGDRGNAWQLRRVNVDLAGINDVLGFVGTLGGGVRSDIAIDNINLQTGDCSPVTPIPTGAIPYYCDFDMNTYCNMNQRTDDNFDWKLYSGPTPTPGTGPTNAYSGSIYLLAEGRGRRAQEVAMIETPILNYVGTVCLSFYYHMWGTKVGYLTVFVSSRGAQNIEWMVNEDKGNRWVNERLTVNLGQLSDRIVFRAQIGPPDSYPYTDIGLDSIQITQGQCVAGPSPPTVTGLPYYCDFETGDITRCNMIQATADNYDWMIYRDSTPTPGTGPTSAQSGIYYVYMEADGHTKQVAILLLPQFNYVGEVCLSYYYHMYGQDQGALYVTTNDRTVTAPWRSIFGNQGNQWNYDQITIDLRDTSYRIGFYGQIGLGIRSDIALDTIRVDQGRCGVATTTTPRPVTMTTTTQRPLGNIPYRCGFEYNQICGMIQRTNDNFDWSPNRGPTDSADTGPDRAYLGDWYLYTESSQPRQPYDKAYIETPPLQYSGTICLTFWYYMYGAGIGRLVVFLNSAGESNPFFSLSGNQGQRWVEVTRELQIPYGDKVVFLGELNFDGNRHQGDIAIDEVQVRPGSCTDYQPVTSTPRPLPPVTGIPLEMSDYYSCTAEYTSNVNDACRVRNFNVPNSKLRWQKISGRTPSSLNNQNRRINGVLYPVTGPETAAEGSWYLYAEASNTMKGDTAGLILEGSDFLRGGPNCLRFSYSMNGFNMGTLTVLGRSRTTNQLKKLWSISRDQLNEWKKAAIDVNGNDVTEITIQAEMTGEFNSDFAIDDIKYLPGSCQPLPSTYEWLCDFELSDGSSTLCSMEQATDDTFDWLLWHGSTPSEETGPDRAYNGEYYIYAEASKPRQPGDRAVIRSPPITQRTGMMCLEFYYSMYGFHMGTLNVYLNNGNNPNDRRSLTTFTKENWQGGAGWQLARVNVNVQYSDRIMFESIVGAAYDSDIALDHIQLRQISC